MNNRRYMKWSKEEIAILLETYPSQGLKACEAALPNRSRKDIHSRVQSIGLKRIGRKTGLAKTGHSEKWVVAKYRELKSKVAVAGLLKISPQTVLDILRKHGAEHISHHVLDDHKEEVIAKYMAEDLDFKGLCNLFGVSKTTMRSSLKRWGVIPPPHRQLTHESLAGGRSRIKKDERYFDIIDTPEKAYWLGLIYADGYNKEGPEWTFVLGLQKRDRELVDKLSMRLLYQIKVTEIPPSSHQWNGLTINGSGSYRLTIHSRHLSEALLRAGVHRAKSATLKFPTLEQVPFHLLSHFMLGYFDGDGCITRHERPPYNRRYGFSLISTEEFCREYQRVLQERLGVNARLHKQLSMTILTLSGNQEIERAMCWLYEGSPVWLSRKREIYNELCSYNVAHPRHKRHSSHKGITFDKTKKLSKPWLVRLRVNGKVKTIGSAATEEEAVILRDQFLIKAKTASTVDDVPA